ncbi:hypothetical protein JCM17845_06360 [Iodidimonas gelatinilytica]|uniref:DUF2147 domain-containing protein n=2 Tax=Iodidimonas gelatinilytica TaxID=1236966 RepID=A0A5A7MVJ4_9PROT|nr:hypothetical protein JCM17845_06360 [Iodidimonas gelatinilytica]
MVGLLGLVAPLLASPVVAGPVLVGPSLAGPIQGMDLQSDFVPDPVKIMGVWKTKGGKSHVLIHPCVDETRLCGSLVWTDSGKRLGETILRDFAFDGARLDGGRIRDPRSGKEYRAELELISSDQLRVKGCWLIFCGDQSWSRASSHLVDVAPNLEQGEDS